MLKIIFTFILKVWGFKVIGPNPELIPKKMYVVYPHTSNWDFLIGISLKFSYPLNVNFVGKMSLFKWPWGWLFRWLGGIPVDRSKRTNFVDSMAKLYSKYDKLSLTIAPEGTRKKVTKFKTGFYYIAHQAQVPLLFVRFDFGTKTVEFSEPMMTTGVYKEDLKKIVRFFKGTTGKNPELACQWEDEDID